MYPRIDDFVVLYNKQTNNPQLVCHHTGVSGSSSLGVLYRERGGGRQGGGGGRGGRGGEEGKEGEG